MFQILQSHCLLPKTTLSKERNRILLLQCILDEIFIALTTPNHPLYNLQKLIKKLPDAFPNKTHKLSTIIHTLFVLCHSQSIQHDHLAKLFFLLEPFMKECKNDESFLFFILSHQKEIVMLFDAKYLAALIAKLYPRGLSSLQKHLCDHFHKKGFAYLLPMIKSLIGQVKNI